MDVYAATLYKLQQVAQDGKTVQQPRKHHACCDDVHKIIKNISLNTIYIIQMLNHIYQNHLNQQDFSHTLKYHFPGSRSVIWTTHIYETLESHRMMKGS